MDIFYLKYLMKSRGLADSHILCFIAYSRVFNFLKSKWTWIACSGWAIMQSGAIFGGLPSGSGPFAVSFIQSSFTSFTFVWHRTQDEIKVEKGTNACIGCSIFVYAAPNFKVSFKCCPYSHAPFTLPFRLTVANVVVVAVVVAAADFVCICVRRLYVFVCGKHLQKATHAAKLHNEAPSIPPPLQSPFPPFPPIAHCCRCSLLLNKKH